MSGDVPQEGSTSRRRFLHRLLDEWGRLISSRGWAVPIGVSLANLGLALFTYADTFHRHLNSGDEYAYLVSAEIFARGKTSVPSPPLKEFFDVVHVVNDGKFYGKYPPGWPLLLAAGVWAGLPWMVNPLIGAATIFALHRLARRHFSAEAANLACLALLGNPFLVFNSASMFSHSSCLLFSVVALDALLTCAASPGSLGASLALGASAGMAFLIRPFTTVVFLAVPAIYLLWQFRRKEARAPLARTLPAAAAAFLVFAGLLLAYNRVQTGDALVQPFQKYAAWDAPSLPQDGQDWEKRLKSHVLVRTLDLGLWLSLSPLFLVAAALQRGIREDPKLRMLILSFASLFTAFFFYWGDGVVQYGPRYLFESVGALCVVTGCVIHRAGRKGLLVLGAVLALNVVTFAVATEQMKSVIGRKKNLFDLVEKRGLTKAIVVLRTGSGSAPVWDCTRNGIDFSGPVLFVRDLGIENHHLFEQHPDREAFYYEYVASRNQGYLTRVGEPR